MTNFTTPENLECELRSSYDAMVRYKNHICIAAMNWKGEYEAEVYEYIDEPKVDGFSEIECRISKIAKSTETFKDSGSAIMWCFNKLN